jgi:transcriptional regulator with XRE-family HTH domain
MAKLTGKIVEARAVRSGEGAPMVGPELRRLRLIAGLTQDHIAARMDIQQAAVSKIEKGGEIYLSTVQRYVEALGASLRSLRCRARP